MFFQKIIETANDHLGALLAFFSSLSALLIGFLTAKKKLFAILQEAIQLFTRPRRIEELLQVTIEKGNQRESQLEKITYALFNGGNEGIVQQVARLSACHSAAFESAPYPAFECTSAGKNTRVNEAYRVLTQVWSSRAIGSGQWQQAIHGLLVPHYLAEFERCAENKEDFVAVVDFKNPMTDEHRGRWRIHAPAAQIGNDCLYVGRFIAALDKTAREIAIEEGWQVKLS